MTTERSTYTYETGERETVMLTRGAVTPPGHALLKIYHSDGKTLDCYVNTAWLRDRLKDLGEPCPLAPDDITEAEWDQIAARAWEYWEGHTILNSHGLKRMMQAALTEPPARPEWADIEDVLNAGWPEGINGAENSYVARNLHTRGVRVVTEEQP